MTKDELTAVFTKLGARNPESWASSQVNEGIPQLARFVFLRGLWQRVTRKDSTVWMDHELRQAEKKPDDASVAATALQKMLALGVDRATINELVRYKEAELLGEICYMMEDSSVVDANRTDDGRLLVRWSLELLDEEDRPVKAINGLHESFWGVEPPSAPRKELEPQPELERTLSEAGIQVRVLDIYPSARKVRLYGIPSQIEAARVYFAAQNPPLTVITILGAKWEPILDSQPPEPNT